MRIKAGNIFYQNETTEDAVFEWELGSTVDISTPDGFLVVRIDPDDFIAVADAIFAAMRKKEKEESKKQSTIG